MGAINNSLPYELATMMDDYAHVSNLPISSCTIQQRTNTVSTAGQPDSVDWVNVSGLIGIACQLAVQSSLRPDQGATKRLPEKFETHAIRHCLLTGYYPQILQQYTAVIDGTRYEIMGVESDSEKVMTRLAVRVFTL